MAKFLVLLMGLRWRECLKNGGGAGAGAGAAATAVADGGGAVGGGRPMMKSVRPGSAAPSISFNTCLLPDLPNVKLSVR